MTRYIRKDRCPTCGEPHWFRFWVGRHCAKSRDGLCVADFDLMFHRFRVSRDALGSRDIEHLMIVEVKTGDEALTPAERDSLSAFNATMNTMIPVSGTPIGISSRPGFIRKGDKKIIWHGVHLLRVPVEPTEVGPFWWDRWILPSSMLSAVLNFDRDPNQPDRLLDVDRRHKRARDGLLPGIWT